MLHLTPKKGHVQNHKTINLILKAQNHNYEPNQPANRWWHEGHALVPSCHRHRLIPTCKHTISKDSQFSDNNAYMSGCLSPSFQIQAYYSELFFLLRQEKRGIWSHLNLQLVYNFLGNTITFWAPSSPYLLPLPFPFTCHRRIISVYKSAEPSKGGPMGDKRKKELISSL